MQTVRLDDLSYRYRGADSQALENVSFGINSGELVLLLGCSGCGKSTLLRLLKPELTSPGEITGAISLFGEQVSPGQPQPRVGFVTQDPGEICVCDTVGGELAFGVENMGLEPSDAARKVADICGFSGLGRMTGRKLSTLSGGERQLTALCSVMAAEPELLILDEPVSRLDPVAAEQLIQTIVRINRETGVTVIAAEHYSQSLFALCDKVILMKKARVIGIFDPQEAARIALADEELRGFVPAAARIAAACPRIQPPLPLTVRDGRRFLEQRSEATGDSGNESRETAPAGKPLLDARELRFCFEKDRDLIDGCDLSLYPGELFTLLGANGSGKTTLLRCLAGLAKPWCGKVRLDGKNLSAYKNGSLYREGIAYLPQEPEELFIKPTVREELEYALKAMGRDKSEWKELLESFNVVHLAQMHPYDLSGGELQLCAIARILVSRPRVLLLDDPVKGLDPNGAELVGKTLRRLCDDGKALLCVTHDPEFAAGYSDRCALFFDGRISGEAPPREFFSASRFYTTAARRITRGIFDRTVTTRDAAEMAGRL